MSDPRTVAFVFPHQLFAKSPVLAERPSRVWLIEDPLFFGDARHPLRFHKQKLAYHRATMSAYRERLVKRGVRCEIDPYPASGESRLDPLCERAAADGATRLVVTDLHDFLLGKRLRRAAARHGLNLRELPSPGFVNDPLDNRDWREGRRRWHMADFYRWQRTRLGVLMDGDEPAGGRWSFDEDNRKRLPAEERARLPGLPSVRRTASVRAAIESVEKDFSEHPGRLDEWHYPTTHAAASRWLDAFLAERFEKFGPYEDAIVRGERWLHHGVLTPMLNTGLLEPRDVLERALEHARGHDVPIASVEGFVRQLIGWREFMRATYDELSVPMRTTNHWRHTRRLPRAFWTAETGIAPLDDVIGRVLDTGYCHHIERLMVLGGFMFLCEIDPDDVYAWFMEMFIDSYDWVMVPNVYAMSQHADGGAITTKPYFSGSNYIRKMSDWGTGDWTRTWDGLFWRWIDEHRKALGGNPRWAMMVRQVERMDPARLAGHREAAEAFLARLDGS